MFASTARKAHHALADGKPSERVPIYKCYNRTQHKALCDGPTTYRAERVDQVISLMLSEIFESIKGVEESELLSRAFQEQHKELHQQFKKAKSEYEIRVKELEKLDSLIVGAVDGSNGFTPERLMRRMENVESEMSLLKKEIDTAQIRINESAALLEKIKTDHRKLVSWAEVFCEASGEVRKMIASSMINAVHISKGYEIDVEYSFDEQQYNMGFDM